MSKVGPEQTVHLSTEELLNVTLLGSEWTSSAGGLSTFNRELAIHLAQHPKVQVSFLVPEGACIYEDKLEAQSYGITVVDAKKRLGFEPLDWLSFPPEHLKMDVVVGHGVKLGRQGQVIREKRNFKWVQVVHTAPEDLSRYKRYPNPISKGERKHEVEVGLCKLADLVVPVGPKLEEAYSSYLRRRKKEQAVFSITPGLFDREFGDLEQDPNENGEFKVLLCGRGDDEDFELKGYNVAAEAFTDHRLKRKPYQLIFVGAPDQKHEEVTAMLVQCGIDKDQLTVRKFLKSREDMKYLLCEVDLAIMPSKSEGFGLVALEALSAGLPILVGRKSGFARALKNFPLGKSCIVDSDDPTEWAEAIEGVRLRHGVRLEEMKALRASYDKRYSWKEQCEALVEKMWRMVREESAAKSLKAVCEPHLKRSVSETNEGAIASSKGLYTQRSRSISEFPFSQGPSRVSGKTSNVEFLFEEQSSADTPDEASAPHLGYQPLLPEEKKTFEIEEDGPSFSDAKSLQTVSNQETPGSTSDTGTETITLQLKVNPEDLNDEQQEIFDNVIQQKVLFMEHDDLCTDEGVGSLTKYLKESHSLTLKTFTSDGLTIIVECPLESLGSLLDDYHSGHLNEVAERCLLTDEIRTILNVDKVKFKTTIEEEPSNVEMFKAAHPQTEPDHDASTRWAETGGVEINPRPPSQKPEQDQGASARWTESGQGAHVSRTASRFPKREPDHRTNTSWANTSFQIQMDRMQETSCTMRAERAKASRTALHKASISGQYDIVKILLDNGEDVDQRDQFSLTPLHLACWYGQESVVRLLLEHGAEVNALDRFQRTPLQKAERHNHQSIVQLLLKSNAKPSCRQPLSLKRLSQQSFLQVDRRSGLNLLQAAVFEGDFDIVFKAHGLLDSLVKEMNSKIGNDTQLFPGKSAVDILSSLEKKRPDHANIDKHYREDVEKFKTLTELHHCTRSGDAEVAVELVLNDGVDVDIPALCNRTPLLWGSLSSSSTMIKTLIDLGADVNAQRTDDKVAPLLLAAGWNNYMATRLLLEHGADVKQRNEHGSSPLNDAVKNNRENVAKLLLENNADLNIQDSEGNSLLHLSVSRGLFKVTQLLIEAGCNIDLRNKSGRTPLYIAVKNKHEGIVKLLLECNAVVGMEYKQNPEERIYLVRGKDKGKSAWHYVLVERLLLGLFLKLTNGGYSLDVKDFGEVFESGWGKNPPENTINNILQTRVDILQEIPGETLLHVASRNNSVSIIDLLVKHGAWNVNARDADGFTPLHEAVVNGNMQAVKKLVDLKADVNQAGAIVDMAHMNKEIEIEEYLKSMIVPTEQMAENQDRENIAHANPAAEAPIFQLNLERLRLIGNTVQREGRQFLDAVYAAAISSNPP